MAFNPSSYFKERYHSDPDFRRKAIESTKRYQATEIGHRNLLRRQKERIREGYYREYCRKRRRKAKAQGLCMRCYNNKAKEGYVCCPKCIKWYRNYDAIKRQDKHRD